VSAGRFARSAAWVVALVVAVALAVSWTVKTDDVALLPARAEAIDQHVTVAGHPRRPGRGAFYITFVQEERTTLLTDWYYRHFDPDADVVSLHALYGPTVPSQQQQQQESQAQMMDSKTQAEVAAFQALGYHVDLQREAAVAGVERRSHAYGQLQINDVILKIDGRAVQTPQQIATVVQALRPGATVTLLVRRATAGGTHTFTLTTHTIAIGTRTAIGVSLMAIATVDPNRLPYKVTIDTGDIGGPSAGLMFTLSIINRLSPRDLTHGHRIAGTGTIDAAGNVGPIGGAKQKVIGAREAGAQYFFVPAYCTAAVCNSREARPSAKGITLVPVNTLDDALAYLRRLR
jgi:PDZ domain-containing protein